MNQAASIRTLYVTLVLLFCGSWTPAQTVVAWTPERCDQLRQLLLKMHQAREFSGTLVICEQGQIRFEESFGYSNIETRKEFDELASYRLASVSKQFIAMAIMMLKEDGKLDYDESITRYLGSLPYDNVSIRHLLNHTSGLPDYMTLMLRHWDPGKALDQRRIACNKDTVAMFAKHQPELLFEPGSKFQYSNTGYVFLGQLVETVAETPIHEFIQRRIFNPLKMEHSHVFSPAADFQPVHRVYGFTYLPQEPGYRVNDDHFLNGMIGDGGIYASARDLVKWDAALNADTLVKQSTLAEAFKPARLNNGDLTSYGFGWGIDNRDDGRFQVSHGGGWVGFRTYISRNITDQRTLIVLTNNSCRHLDQVFDGLSKIAAGKTETGDE